MLPTALSLMDVPPQDKDLLGRWKPEGSNVYARSFGGRVARLQALFAGAAREADRYTRLDEREIAADLVPWLMERPMEGGGALVPRPGSGYSHVRRATARSADAGWRP